MFALYEGIHKLQHPEPLTSPLVAVVILVVAIGLETYSFRTAIVESRQLKGDGTWWEFIRQSKVPELPVVLLEDLGALFGLVFALLGVGLAVLTGDPVWDAHRHDRDRRAARRHRDHPDHRDEEPADRRGRHRRRSSTRSSPALRGRRRCERVIHIRTQYLGPDELLVAAKIALRPGLPVEEVAAGHRRGRGRGSATRSRPPG